MQKTGNSPMEVISDQSVPERICDVLLSEAGIQGLPPLQHLVLLQGL